MRRQLVQLIQINYICRGNSSVISKYKQRNDSNYSTGRGEDSPFHLAELKGIWQKQEKDKDEMEKNVLCIV